MVKHRRQDAREESVADTGEKTSAQEARQDIAIHRANGTRRRREAQVAIDHHYIDTKWP